MDIDARGRSGETMLHGAVLKGDVQLVKFFLNSGANLNIPQLKYRYATTFFIPVMNKLQCTSPPRRIILIFVGL